MKIQIIPNESNIAFSSYILVFLSKLITTRRFCKSLSIIGMLDSIYKS